MAESSGWGPRLSWRLLLRCLAETRAAPVEIGAPVRSRRSAPPPCRVPVAGGHAAAGTNSTSAISKVVNDVASPAGVVKPAKAGAAVPRRRRGDGPPQRQGGRSPRPQGLSSGEPRLPRIFVRL